MKTTIYARVSTAQQDIKQQKQKLWNYVTEELDVDPSEIVVCEDQATGGNTDRSGYQKLMDQVESEQTDRVVVRSITRLGRNMRDLNNAVHTIIDDHEIGLIVVNDGIHIEPGAGELNLEQKSVLYGLSFAADIEHEMIKQRTIDGLRAAEQADKWIGRPIYGFTSEDGDLRADDEEYEKAVQAIVAKEELDWSQRKIDRKIGVPRRTVPNILERKEIYLSDVNDDRIDAISTRLNSGN